MNLAGYAAIRTAWKGGRRSMETESGAKTVLLVSWEDPDGDRKAGESPGQVDLSRLTTKQVEALRSRFASEPISIDLAGADPKDLAELVRISAEQGDTPWDPSRSSTS